MLKIVIMTGNKIHQHRRNRREGEIVVKTKHVLLSASHWCSRCVGKGRDFIILNCRVMWQVSSSTRFLLYIGVEYQTPCVEALCKFFIVYSREHSKPTVPRHVEVSYIVTPCCYSKEKIFIQKKKKKKWRKWKGKKECKHSLKVSSLCQNFIHNTKSVFINIELTLNKHQGLR